MSQKFGYVWQRMLMKYPDLSLDYRNRTGQRGYQKRRGTAWNEGRAVFHLQFRLRTVAVALRRSCQNSAESMTAFVVLPVTIDTPLPEFENTRPDNGIAARLGVETVPSWYLAYPVWTGSS